MATDAILETIKPRRCEDLPVTTAGKSGGGESLIGLRRRMSSFSVRIQPLASSSSGAAEALLRRARSMPSVKALAAGGALRRWWDWGLGWVTARGLDMSDGDGECHGAGKGAWRHVLHKLRAGARRLLGRDGRPNAAAQDFRYDSFSYAQNFDDGDAA